MTTDLYTGKRLMLTRYAGHESVMGLSRLRYRIDDSDGEGHTMRFSIYEIEEAMLDIAEILDALAKEAQAFVAAGGQI